MPDEIDYVEPLCCPREKRDIDEPRKEEQKTGITDDLFTTDFQGRQLKGWTNKLIWGDN